jgi:cytochrome c-type biogenesis protein CcmH/NrfG
MGNTKMNHTKNAASQSTADPAQTSAAWTSQQAYLLAAFCLLLGVASGYLFRGSASLPPAQAAASTTTSQPRKAPHSEADPSAKAALAEAAVPLLDAVSKDPSDYDSLVKLGNLYYDGQQFANAIQYYERALVIHPDNPDVRTDMGTAFWYTGNADKALAELQTSLKYRPGHPQTLFNLGWVRWQGKTDPKGAVEAWQSLLKANPDYPGKQQVEQYIAKAKEHAARG